MTSTWSPSLVHAVLHRAEVLDHCWNCSLTFNDPYLCRLGQTGKRLRSWSLRRHHNEMWRRNVEYDNIRVNLILKYVVGTDQCLTVYLFFVDHRFLNFSGPLLVLTAVLKSWFAIGCWLVLAYNFLEESICPHTPDEERPGSQRGLAAVVAKSWCGFHWCQCCLG